MPYVRLCTVHRYNVRTADSFRLSLSDNSMCRDNDGHRNACTCVCVCVMCDDDDIDSGHVCVEVFFRFVFILKRSVYSFRFEAFVCSMSFTARTISSLLNIDSNV